MESSLSDMAAVNLKEYGDEYSRLRFACGKEAEDAEARRADLLEKLAAAGATSRCLDTKFHSGLLSPGCETCMAGKWSCLFVNGLCNGRCFFCPTPQNSKSEPATNNLRFANPQDYLDYVAHFGFAGVSISGGEPLATFDRTLTYVSKLKRRFGGGIHLWMYTNGILATEERIGRLAEAGLDEIRFNIVPEHYSLEKVKLALGRIPCVTIEVPAIPEDYRLLSGSLPALADIGVNHLNLHQLRCTPHNLNNLVARGYLFSHGPRVLVVESELVALRLLLDAASGRAPAVNYCSHAYKFRFQARAARLRTAGELADPFEDVTDAGFIRRLAASGDEVRITELVDRLTEAAVPAAWKLDGPGSICFSASLWPLIDLDGLNLQVSYFACQLRESPSYKGRTLKIPINRRRTLVAERVKVGSSRTIGEDEVDLFMGLISDRNSLARRSEGRDMPGSLADIYEMEHLPGGLWQLDAG